MTIKSLLLVLGFSIAGVSAAESANHDSLKQLIAGVADATKTSEDIKEYVKDLQAQIYGLIDNEEVARAEELFDSVFEGLSELYSELTKDEAWKAGSETLDLIAEYIHAHQ